MKVHQWTLKLVCPSPTGLEPGKPWEFGELDHREICVFQAGRGNFQFLSCGNQTFKPEYMLMYLPRRDGCNQVERIQVVNKRWNLHSIYRFSRFLRVEYLVGLTNCRKLLLYVCTAVLTTYHVLLPSYIYIYIYISIYLGIGTTGTTRSSNVFSPVAPHRGTDPYGQFTTGANMKLPKNVSFVFNYKKSVRRSCRC
jgi:hypothetical protein